MDRIGARFFLYGLTPCRFNRSLILLIIMKIYTDKLSPAAQDVFLKMIINTRVDALMQNNDAKMAAIDEIDRLYVKACVATKLAESDD